MGSVVSKKYPFRFKNCWSGFGLARESRLWSFFLLCVVDSDAPVHNYPSRAGGSQDYSKQKGGPTVSKWGYSPDCHGVFATCCRLFAKKEPTKGERGGGGGESHGHPRAPPWLRPCSRVIYKSKTRLLSKLNEKRWINIYFMLQKQINYEEREKRKTLTTEINTSLNRWRVGSVGDSFVC